jgi:hypothetical protein
LSRGSAIPFLPRKEAPFSRTSRMVVIMELALLL